MTDQQPNGPAPIPPRLPHGMDDRYPPDYFGAVIISQSVEEHEREVAAIRARTEAWAKAHPERWAELERAREEAAREAEAKRAEESARGVERARMFAGQRFRVREGSKSAHCCFKFTVIDTARDRDDRTVCECFDEEQAVRVAKALNAQEGTHG